MSEVQESPSHERGRPVGKDVAELGREVGNRRRRGDGQLELRMAQDLDFRLERRPLVAERPGVVLALIRRLAPGEPAGARDPRARADIASNLELAQVRARFGGEHLAARALEGPTGLEAPAP